MVDWSFGGVTDVSENRVTLREAAEISGYTQTWLRELMRRGELAYKQRRPGTQITLLRKDAEELSVYRATRVSA